jgi:hypothetical protein
MQQGNPGFYRRRILLKGEEEGYSSQSTINTHKFPAQEKPTVLVINSSNQMASTITKQLTIGLPECVILYSPSLALASWMLKRRKISLIIASQILPDGGTDKLKAIVQELESPPDIIIVGRHLGQTVSRLSCVGYKITSHKKLISNKGYEDDKKAAQNSPAINDKPNKSADNDSLTLKAKLSSLGADLRNDLNNPLQEIVTMAFIVKQQDAKSSLTDEAIIAIEKAAGQLAGTVERLEQRIVRAVTG